ncbi:regulator of G-protein signaling 22-like [Arapaima gigas]
MSDRILTTDPPDITSDNFEDLLSSDELLVYYFNKFLKLLVFSTPIKYNKEFEIFEVVSETAESISKRIRAAVSEYKLKPASSKTMLSISTLPDNRCTVLCLDREQGIQWIKKERLPLFLQSDCYFEYRLAKLLSQVDSSNLGQSLLVDLTYQPWAVSPQPHPPPSVPDGSDTLMTTLCESLGQASMTESSPWFSLAEGGQALLSTQAALTPVCSPRREPGLSSPGADTADATSTPGSSVLLSEGPLSTRSSSQPTAVSGQDVDISTPEVVAPSLVSSIRITLSPEVDGAPQHNFEGSGSDQSGSVTRREGSAGPCEGTEHAQQRDRGNMFEVGDEIEDSYHSNKIYNLEEFKKSLKGTAGEKLFYLWIDIERLKALQNVKRKNRLLLQMKDHYLLSGGPCTLSVEMLSRLNIASTLCWREDKLRLVQAYITDVMLLYWSPRFWMVQSPSGESSVAHLRFWREQQLQLLMGIDPYTRAISLLQEQRSKSCVPWGAYSGGRQLGDNAFGCETRDWGDDTERMLQALGQESRAGFFFTCFCEHSGNQLWESCIHFWCDLQLFYQLFSDDGLDLFRQQRQAQLLYYTYLCPSAPMSVGVEEECRRQVHSGLTAPHKGLFEQAEHHTVTVLREPWSLLMAQDELTFSSVHLWEEMRYVDAVYYKKLQALHRKSLRTLSQSPSASSTPQPLVESPKEPDPWTLVPEQFRNYHLGHLLRRRQDLKHFHDFLEENFASTDLMCWLEIGQLRRTPQRDEIQRIQQSETIRGKYLNRKYFFGPNSPATRKEQEEVLHLVGGWGQLLRGSLSVPVLTQVQNLVRHRIEKKWLPLYLATPQFAERQRMQAQVSDVEEDEFTLRQRKKREMWKMDFSWMASAKELPDFCRALLNPVTCLEFRRFVSLKGDFLENGVLFWLEVQKYKDLHQSHSDEATIQQKVNTIISCFINSSIPPALQIDIPPEQARRILEQKRELGPYVFQEAQMTVLGDLFKLWPEFTAFKNSVEEQMQVLPLLDRHKAEQREQLKRQREEEKERKAKVRGQQIPSFTTHLHNATSKLSSHFAEGLFGEDGSGYGSGHEDLTWGAENGDAITSSRPLCWSYSRYVAALDCEELLLQRHIQQEQGLSSPLVSRTGSRACEFRSRTADSSSGRRRMSKVIRRLGNSVSCPHRGHS